MKTLFVVITVVVLVVGGIVGVAYSGVLDVSATAKEPDLIGWLLRTSRERSVERRAADISVPDLSAETKVANGAKAFGEMCAGCHGAPGREPFTGAQDMNPAPPDLAKVAEASKPAELFWVIKHGIRMTGMPAWGQTHSDEQLWDLVAFVERLPSLSVAEYQDLAQRGSTHGHDHEHGGLAGSGPEPHEHGAHGH